MRTHGTETPSPRPLSTTMDGLTFSQPGYDPRILAEHTDGMPDEPGRRGLEAMSPSHRRRSWES